MNKIKSCQCGVTQRLQMTHAAYPIFSNKEGISLCPLCGGEYVWKTKYCKCKRPKRCTCKTKYKAVGNVRIAWIAVKCPMCVKCGYPVKKYLKENEEVRERFQDKINKRLYSHVKIQRSKIRCGLITVVR